MKYRIFFCILLSLVLSLSFASGKLSPSEKQGIEETISSMGSDATKFSLALVLIDSTSDLSDEPELRQKIIDKATSLGINMDPYPNIMKGAVPVYVQQKELEKSATTTIAGSSGSGQDAQQAQQVVQGGIPGGGAVGEGVQKDVNEQLPGASSGLEQKASGFSAGTIILLVGILVIFVLIGWWYGKRRAK